MAFLRPKVQPIPPAMPHEIKIGRKPRGRAFKFILLSIFLILVGIGLWIGVSLNSAIGKITGESTGQKSSIFSLFDTSDLKGQAQGRTNILLLGMGGKNHPGGTLSDTMIVLSIDHQNKKLGMISIPRDLWVPIPGYGSAKINEAYADGEKDKKKTGGGGVLASRTVENILGIPIHYYVSADFEGFKKIIDSVGGVDVNVEKDLYDPYYPAADMIHYDPFSIKAGQHHLDGATALKYARSRETTSDFDRSKRQEQVMIAVKQKIFTLGILSNPKKITDLLGILGDHIRTNMSVTEIKAFWDSIQNLDTSNIINKVLDTSVGGPLIAGSDSRGYYIYPKKGMTNFSDLQVIAKNLFNLPSTSTSKSPAKIEVQNATGKTGLASGVAADLEKLGFDVIRTSNATRQTSTVIYECSDGEYTAQAKQVATELGGVYDSTKSCTKTGVDIQVILGTSYQSQ